MIEIKNKRRTHNLYRIRLERVDEAYKSFIFSRKFCANKISKAIRYLYILKKMAVTNTTTGQLDAQLAGPKYGTLIPNRIFVGGIR